MEKSESSVCTLWREIEGLVMVRRICRGTELVRMPSISIFFTCWWIRRSHPPFCIKSKVEKICTVVHTERNGMKIPRVFCVNTSVPRFPK